MRWSSLFAILLLSQPAYAGHSHGSTAAPLLPSAGVIVNIAPDNTFPFVNFLKQTAGSPQSNTSSFIYPNFINAQQFPNGTLPAASGIFTTYGIPTNYFGQFVIAGVGTFGATELGSSGTPMYGTVYSVGSGTTVTGCSSFPCPVQGSLTFSGTNPVVTYDYSLAVTGAASDSGLVKLSVSNTGMANGQTITVTGVVGSDGNGCGANGSWTISNRTTTTIDLAGSTFPGGCTWSSGGQVFPYQNTGQINQYFSEFLAGGTFSNVTQYAICKSADYAVDNTCNSSAAKAWAGGFNNDYIQALAALKPAAFRFLNVNGACCSASPSYATWPSQNFFSYGFNGRDFIPSQYAGSTTGTNNYSVTCSSPCTYTLTSGAPVEGDVLEFNAINAQTTGNSTLTVTDSASVTSAAIPMMPQAGMQLTGKVSGTPTAGDVWTITFTVSSLGAWSCGSSSTTAQYTVQSLDTASSLGLGLINAINANSDLTTEPVGMLAQASSGSNTNIQVGYGIQSCSVSATVAQTTGSGPETVIFGTSGYQIGSGDGSFNSYIAAHQIYHAVYSSVDKAWLIVAGGANSSWPWLTQIELAQAVSTASGKAVGCWLQVPWTWGAADHTAMASFVHANSCPGGTWIQLANEIWNDNDVAYAQGQAYSLALNMPFAYANAMVMQIRRFWPIYTAAFSTNPSQLKTVVTYNNIGTGGLSAFVNNIQGQNLCGTSCGQQGYQNFIGTDWNSSPNWPATYLNVLSTAPYYEGSVMQVGYPGNSSGYGTWSATSSTVSSNQLVVSGTVTGLIEPNDGIAGCDGVIIAGNYATAQTSGTVQTTLNGAASSSTWTLTSVAGISTGMWIYDVTTGTVNGKVASVNSGAKTISITGTTYTSAGTNDTILFGGLAGTYALNSTSCSIASSTITGGQVLGFQYAIDNDTGNCPSNCNGSSPYGVPNDGFSWAYWDGFRSALNGVMQTTTTAQSYYRDFNSAKSVVSNFPGMIVADYEGAYQANWPTAAQATAIGLPSSAYGGYQSFGYTFWIDFKNSHYFFDLETSFFNLEFGIYPPGSFSNWFAFDGNGNVNGIEQEWALYPNTLYYPPAFTSYNAIGCYNGNASLCLPYLLKRDLDPAANDNSPAFLDKAA